MTPFQEQKQQALHLFDAAIALAQGYKQPDLARRLREAATHLAQGKLIVVVCGEFKQGKSSLINALINEPDLFPTDIEVTTSLVSTITSGASEKITVVLGEPGATKNKEITIQRSQIPDYVTEQRNPRNKQQAKILVIEAPNERLREGLVLVDTPGVGALNTNHTEVTYAFIPSADVVLYVSDALTPLSTHDLEFIKERILPHCQNLLFALTRIDKNAQYRTIVEDNRKKLAEALKRPPEKIEILPVSNMLKLQYLKTQEQEDLEDSHFTELEHALWRLLEEDRIAILLLGALTKLGQGIVEMRRPLQAEWEVYQQQTDQERDQLERRYQEARERLQRLLDNNADWQIQLNRGLAGIRAESFDQFRRGFVEIRRKAEHYCNDPQRREQPSQILSLLQADVAGLMAQISKQISQRVAEVQFQVETASGLILNPFEPDPLNPGTGLDGANVAGTKHSGFGERLLESGRSMNMAGSAGSFVLSTIGAVAGGILGSVFPGIGTVAGAVLGGGLGAVVGRVWGWLTGRKQAVEQRQEREKQQLLKALLPLIDDAQRDTETALNTSMMQVEAALQDDLRALIKRQKESNEQSLQSVQAARKLSEEQAKARVADLKGQLQRLGQIQSSAEALARPALEQLERGARRKAQTEANSDDNGGWADE